MSWIADCLKQQKKASTPQTAIPVQSPPSWRSVWNKLAQVIEADVLEFNAARGPQYMISSSAILIQIVPKQPPTDLAVFQIDSAGIIQVDCPISHPGVPRRGHFKIKGDYIVSSGDFVGQHQPSNEPMTPGRVSEFILKPLLFPELSMSKA